MEVKDALKSNEIALKVVKCNSLVKKAAKKALENLTPFLISD